MIEFGVGIDPTPNRTYEIIRWHALSDYNTFVYAFSEGFEVILVNFQKGLIDPLVFLIMCDSVI